MQNEQQQKKLNIVMKKTWLIDHVFVICQLVIVSAAYHLQRF